MKLAFACPFYGPTQPLVGFSQRANLVAATTAGHTWVGDFSTINLQHRQGCEAILRATIAEPELDAVFWTEHDVVLPPDAVVKLAAALTSIPQAAAVTGVTFRRSSPHAPMVSLLAKVTPADYEAMKESPTPYLRTLARDLSYPELCDTMLVSLNAVDTTAPPFPVAAASMTCFLIRRAALLTLSHISDLFAARAHMSIDGVFWTHARKAGLPLYCDPSVLCGHMSAEPEIITRRHWEAATSALTSKPA